MFHKFDHVLLTALQALLAIVFSTFAYFQMQLTSGLGEGRVDGIFAILTALLFVLFVGLDLWEDYRRGSLYAELSAQMKTNVAQVFIMDSFHNHSQKTNEEHVSYFTGELDTVLNQHYYFSLYQPKLLFQFGAGFAVLLIISWQCGLAVTAAAVGFALVIKLFGKKLAEKQRKVQEKKARFVDTISDLHNGYEEIHLNQMEHLAELDFASCNEALEQAQCDYRLVQYGIETLGVGQNMFIYILILIVGWMLAYRGYTGLGIFVSAASLSVQLLNHWSLLSRIKASKKGAESLKLALDAYLLQSQKEESPSQSETSSSLLHLYGVQELSEKKENEGKQVLLRASGVSYGYEGGASLMENVDLEFERGHKYLITGNSGSGKSTLLELLNGHRDCATGSIVRYTDKVAYIPQNPFLFHGTLRENLVFEGDVKDEELLAMLRKLDLDFPLDLVVEEGGSNLSGGEKVRVVLARALLSHPDLLITDELTANLDVALGRKIEEMLLSEYPEIGLCSVAHRTYCGDRYDKRWNISAKTWEVK